MALPKPSTTGSSAYYTVYYYCWNTSTLAPVTGDASNHTVYISKDGGTPAAAANSPSELSSQYMPGWYKIALTQTEFQCNSLIVVPRSTTENVACTVREFYTDRGHLIPIKAQTDKLTFNDNNFIAAEIRGHDSNWYAPIQMSQALPATPATGTVGEALKFADTRLDAAISSRATPSDIANTPVTLTGAEHDQIESDVAAAMTGQGYTSARAAKLDNLNATVSSRAAPGDAMTLTSSERSSVASAVWSATTRTLTSFGTLVSDIWSHSTRTLTSFGTLATDVANAVWSATTRTLTSFGTLVSDIWSYSSRTLTSFGSLVSDVANAVWSAGTRTLTSFGSLASDVAQAVWSYTIEASQSALAWMRLMGAVLFNKRTYSSGNVTYRDYNDTKNRIVGTEDQDGNRTITSRDGS